MIKLPLTKFYSMIDQIYDNECGGNVKRWLLLLPGAGCTWAKKSGGCTMCAFKYTTYKYTRGKLLPSFIFTSLYNYAHLDVKKEMPKIIAIYNGGSFLNNEEIPYDIQTKICEKVYNDKSLFKLFVESRPEYVQEEKIKILKDKLKNKKLMVGIGLESVTDIIRNRCIHKGFSRENFEGAVKILKKNGVSVLVYIFIKPILLTEKEAIDEAIKTANYAFSQGVDQVAFQSAFIQKGTIMERLFREGKFRPPWLWSILKIAKATNNLGFITLGGFEDTPPPIEIPKNCELCSNKIYKLLNDFKKNHNIRIFDDLRCDCKKNWELEIDTPSIKKLEDRIIEEGF